MIRHSEDEWGGWRARGGTVGEEGREGESEQDGEVWTGGAEGETDGRTERGIEAQKESLMFI